MTNIHPVTGIAYGVISCSSLDPDLVQELMYGPQSKDLTYDAAYEEAKAEAGANYDLVYDQACEHVDKLGLIVTTKVGMDEIESYLEHHLNGYIDRDEYIDGALDQFSDTFNCDEPVIEGEHEGVKYHIGWLGGAPILWVTEGPIGAGLRLCSPCIPNAVDLDSGMVPEDEGHLCYVVPQDWLAQEVTC